jgi:hypothetical protein
VRCASCIALSWSARRDYERDNAVVLSPGEFLRLLTTDPYFEWLRGLSELMVDTDIVAMPSQRSSTKCPWRYAQYSSQRRKRRNRLTPSHSTTGRSCTTIRTLRWRMRA